MAKAIEYLKCNKLFKYILNYQHEKNILQFVCLGLMVFIEWQTTNDFVKFC